MRQRFNPPEHSADFERLSVCVLKVEWRIPEVQRHGRPGQEQFGVDIVDLSGSQPPRGGQCKLHGPRQRFTVKELRNEVRKATHYKPELRQYWVLTTAFRSRQIQDEVQRINREHHRKELFKVVVWFWEDIEDLLNNQRWIQEEFYESIPGREAAVLKERLDSIEGKIDRLGTLHSRGGTSFRSSGINFRRAFPPDVTSLLTPASGAAGAAPVDEALAEVAKLASKNRLVVITGDVLDDAVALSREQLDRIVHRFENGPSASDRSAMVEFACDRLQTVPGGATLPYQCLAALPISAIVSLHPDPVLESVLVTQEPGYQSIVTDDDAVLELDTGSRELFLLGGSVRFKKGLVLTSDDRQRLIERTKHLAQRLRRHLALRDILLVNCDLSDRHIKKLFLVLTWHRTRAEGKLFVTGPVAPDEFWLEKYNVTVLTGGSTDVLSRLAVLAASTPSSTTPAPPPRVVPPGATPYKYLYHYDAEDGSLFFGRDEETSTIARKILGADRRVTILCGQSGVGKTSFVKASLMPYLERLEDEDLMAVYARCGDDPVRSIIAATVERIPEARRPRRLSLQLAKALEQLYAADPRSPVIFIDQMEEAFIKLDPQLLNPQLIVDFAAAMERCLETDTPARFVFVIREDHLSRMALLGRTLPGVLLNPCRLDDLTWQQARDAILKPATLCGMRVEDGLAEAILSDLDPKKILPAHLQIVCDRLYQTCQQSRIMSLEVYNTLGRASAILRGHLEQAMANISRELDAPARQVLAALVTSERTKHLLTMEAIAGQARLPLDVAKLACHDLIHRGRLVREVPGQNDCYELSHESLAESIGQWMTEIDRRIRTIHELLHHDVGLAHKSHGHVIARDRLKLIEEHHRILYLHSDAIRLILASHVVQGAVPSHWWMKAAGLSPEDLWEALFFRPVRANPRAIDELVRPEPAVFRDASANRSDDVQPPRTSLANLPRPSGVPQDITTKLARWLEAASPDTMFHAMPICNRLASPELGQVLINRLGSLGHAETTRFFAALAPDLDRAMADALERVARAAEYSADLPVRVANLIERFFVQSKRGEFTKRAFEILTRMARAGNTAAQRHTANLEQARLGLIGGVRSDVGGVVEAVFSGAVSDASARTGIDFLILYRGEAALRLLARVHELTAPRRGYVVEAIRDDRTHGAKIVRDFVAQPKTREVAVAFACEVLETDKSHSPWPELTSVLADALDTLSGELIVRVARLFIAGNDHLLADAFIERLPALDEDTAMSLLSLPWPDHGWVAARLLQQCHTGSLEKYVLAYVEHDIGAMSGRAIALMLTLGREVAEGITHALVEASSGDPDRPQNGTLTAALDNRRTVQDDLIRDIKPLWLRIKYVGHSLSRRDDATIAAFLADRERLPRLSTRQVLLVLEVIGEWLEVRGGFSALEPKLRFNLMAASASFRERSKNSDELLGRLNARDAEAAVESLFKGTADEREACLDELVGSRLVFTEPLALLVRSLARGGMPSIRAKAALTLVRRGDSSGFEAVCQMLSSQAASLLPIETVRICSMAVNEGAKALTAEQLIAQIKRKGIAPLLLPELLRSHAALLTGNLEVLGLALNALSTLPTPDATAWRVEAARLLPELRQRLKRIANIGSVVRREQAAQLLRVFEEA
jgi:hypothetical protein